MRVHSTHTHTYTHVYFKYTTYKTGFKYGHLEHKLQKDVVKSLKFHTNLEITDTHINPQRAGHGFGWSSWKEPCRERKKRPFHQCQEERDGLEPAESFSTVCLTRPFLLLLLLSPPTSFPTTLCFFLLLFFSPSFTLQVKCYRLINTRRKIFRSMTSSNNQIFE